MPAGRYVGILVPLTVEEMEVLSALAVARGNSLIDLIRARVFDPHDATGRFLANDEELTSMIARLEGVRIRARGRQRIGQG